MKKVPKSKTRVFELKDGRKIVIGPNLPVLHPIKQWIFNLLNFRTIAVLEKNVFCEKCYGEMKEDQDVGWEPLGEGNIAGYEVHTYTCIDVNCGHKHVFKRSRD